MHVSHTGSDQTHRLSSTKITYHKQRSGSLKLALSTFSTSELPASLSLPAERYAVVRSHIHSLSRPSRFCCSSTGRETIVSEGSRQLYSPQYSRPYFCGFSSLMTIEGLMKFVRTMVRTIICQSTKVSLGVD